MRLALLILLVACDDKKSVNDYLVRSATKSVAELKQILAAPAGAKQPIDWGMVTRCADMANIDELEKLKRPLADELRRLCTKDVPLAMMTAETAKAEADTDPDIKLACHSPTFGFAKEKMIEAGTIDLAKDVVARFTAACPDRK